MIQWKDVMSLSQSLYISENADVGYKYYTVLHHTAETIPKTPKRNHSIYTEVHTHLPKKCPLCCTPEKPRKPQIEEINK